MGEFKVGDRVRYIKGTYPFGNGQSVPDRGEVVSAPDGDGDYAIRFKGWDGGWNHGGYAGCHWYLREDQIELAPPAAKFQVVYVEDDDQTFDTQEDAEAAAYDLARNEPGSKFAVFKRIATATTGAVAIERLA